VKIAHVDKVVLGERLARARESAGMTQDGLGHVVHLDRTAISRLEAGERKLSVPELVAIAEALSQPLSYFVSAPVPAVVSRRSNPTQAHETTAALDIDLEAFAADVRTLVEMDQIVPAGRPVAGRTPKSHPAAEALAQECRQLLDLGHYPIEDLGETCERLGLYSYAAPLGTGGPDGGCVEVGDGLHAFGAAVINGDAPAGRRRMTLAHELGHWLSGDAYDQSTSADGERMLSSFAIHFLAPRAGVQHVWDQHPDWAIRDRALAVGAAFRLSWSATIGQLRNLGFIETSQRMALSEDDPRSGDYKRLRLSWTDELAAPYVSPAYASACLDGYVTARLTASRCIELLRGTVSEPDLPRQAPATLDDLRASFTIDAR
jgi:transcriptional regulator with XRE-family HTH domain/Zn-dependent peptidase ImmA (M78 family)